jgi:ribosomal protein S18 acetylase RimI-like enzyme
MTRGEFLIEPFSSAAHERDAFACGNQALDEYIRRYASKDVKRRVSLVFVASWPGERVVRGYYSLSAASFQKEDLPRELARKLPHYPVPAAIIGRLAVDRSCQCKGLGAQLLMDCFDRVVQASEIMAVYAIVADAKDEAAKAFYTRYGFASFVDQPLRLFIPMATVRQLWGK